VRNGRQPKWDIYEAVILLDGYLEAQHGSQPKSHIVKRISVDLRRMALNRGIQIDDVYRNENGISYQIQSMETAVLTRFIVCKNNRFGIRHIAESIINDSIDPIKNKALSHRRQNDE